MNFAPVPAREHAIVWEIRPDEARGALFDFGAEQRIVLRRTWRATRGAPLPSFLKLKQFRKVPVIVALHPALARTFILPFRMTRKKSEPPIQPEQMQNLLQEFIAKTTFEMRRLAASALGVEELDAILLDARLTSLMVDGAEVREDQPVDGHRIEGFLQVLLTTRAVFHDLHELLHSGREIFFTERGPAALAFLGRHLQGQIFLLDLEAGGGWLFQVDRDAEEVIKKTQFRWDAQIFPNALADAWGLSASAAKRAYAMFLSGGFSDTADRFTKKLFQPLEESFERLLGKTKLDSQVYLRAVLPLPLELPAISAGIKLVDMPLAKLLQGSGLTFGLPPGNSAETSFFLMPFLEYYYHRGDPRGHKALTRHIHWITA